jgi:hypothetical protein
MFGTILFSFAKGQHLRRPNKRPILVSKKTMPRKNPLDVNTVNLDDTADRNAFYGTLIANGARPSVWGATS